MRDVLTFAALCGFLLCAVGGALSRGSSITSVSDSLNSLALNEEEAAKMEGITGVAEPKAVAATHEDKIMIDKAERAAAAAPARYSRPWMEQNLWDAADRVDGLKEGWAKDRGIEIMKAYCSRPSYLQSWEAESRRVTDQCRCCANTPPASPVDGCSQRCLFSSHLSSCHRYPGSNAACSRRRAASCCGPEPCVRTRHTAAVCRDRSDCLVCKAVVRLLLSALTNLTKVMTAQWRHRHSLACCRGRPGALSAHPRLMHDSP
jgi:hypothetical protein